MLITLCNWKGFVSNPVHYYEKIVPFILAAYSSLCELLYDICYTSALPMGFLPNSHPQKLMINYSIRTSLPSLAPVGP